MPRTINFDFRKGSGSPLDIPYGFISIFGTAIRDNSPSRVLPLETKVALQDGKATITNVQSTGTGPVYDWGYWVEVEAYTGERSRFLVGVPDGTTTLNFIDLPFLSPATGEILVDIAEWTALYGDLPSRVSATETKNTSQDTKISALESPTANGKVRVDTTVGTRVFITDGVTERMVSADTGQRDVTALLSNGWTTVSGQSPKLRREGSTVTLRGYLGRGTDPLALTLPSGFRPDAIHVQGAFYGLGTPSTQVGVELSGSGSVRILGSNATGTTHYCYWRWSTVDTWPTSLPGTAA